jgi:3-phenylpropionate/trans-cinnamate dioxygenase ferredoxin reductase subunit
MSGQKFEYIVAGGGLAGASAVEGIREIDKSGAVLLVGAETDLPYDRPPLTKKLWFGKKKVEEIFVHDRSYYDQNDVTLSLGRRLVSLDAAGRTVTDDRGGRYGYEKLLLATGGNPRRLTIPGGDLDGICHYRYLPDYVRIKGEAREGKSAIVVGGGFIGSEIAAALATHEVNVTMVFPEPYLCSRVFTPSLGKAINSLYLGHGVTLLAGERPVSIAREREKFALRTTTGGEIVADMVIVGVGITPNIELGAQAGLSIGDGLIVNEYLETSAPRVFAAGDVASFPYLALGRRARVEHWDNAVTQGKWAGRNMAGARTPYSHMPYFYSDLFEFGYEAVGDVDSRLETFADWKKPNDTGVIYYLKEGRVRGAMMCNVWEKVDAARGLIQKAESRTAEGWRGAIT